MLTSFFACFSFPCPLAACCCPSPCACVCISLSLLFPFFTVALSLIFFHPILFHASFCCSYSCVFLNYVYFSCFFNLSFHTAFFCFVLLLLLFRILNFCAVLCCVYMCICTVTNINLHLTSDVILTVHRH